MDFVSSVNRFRQVLLSTMPYAKEHSGGRWITFRCPYCFDSKKHIDTTHFNVSIPSKQEDIIFMKCFQPECECNKGKVVRVEDLRVWGIQDNDIVKFIREINKSKGGNSRRYDKLGGYRLLNIPPKNDKLSLEKLEYINTRLGINLSLLDLPKYKIFLSFNDILYYNKIKLTQDMTEKRAYYLENSSIGFISKDNAYLIFRDVYKKQYSIYNVLNEDRAHKYYTIPNTIDIMKPVKIYMAEGVFDILSAYFNVVEDKEQSIFVAVAGASYEYVIRQLIRNGFIDCEFHIFSDIDVSTKYYKEVKKNIGDYKFNNPISIYYNTLEKDIGVPKDRIELKVDYI